jgi:hypothetical protein
VDSQYFGTGSNDETVYHVMAEEPDARAAGLDTRKKGDTVRSTQMSHLTVAQ